MPADKFLFRPLGFLYFGGGALLVHHHWLLVADCLPPVVAGSSYIRQKSAPKLDYLFDFLLAALVKEASPVGLLPFPRDAGADPPAGSYMRDHDSVAMAAGCFASVLAARPQSCTSY